MKTKLAFLVVAALSLAACGGSGTTDTGPARYNFAVVDGSNQVSTAGDVTLSKPITSELTRDPNGTFAKGGGVFDFLLPAKAFAQGLTLKGTPVANTIVCGRITASGEPQIVPICAYTDTAGKVPSTIMGGTKAGKFNLLYTAQVPAGSVVADSTSVTVNAGAVTVNQFSSHGGVILVGPASSPDIVYHLISDKYGNAVPYKILTDCCAHAPNATPTSGPPWPLIADSIGTGKVWIIVASGDTVATGFLSVYNNGTGPNFPGLQTNLYFNGNHP